MLFPRSRKKTFICLGIVAIMGLVLVQSCRKDPDIDKAGSSISFATPQGWPEPVYKFASNPLTQQGFELGRKLFYDPRLSRTNQISCGSCHQAFAAFAQTDHAISHGVDDKLGTRNSPGLFNLAWHPTFMWDGGVNHIELQPAAPIANVVEMDETLPNIVAKLNADADYRARFTAAFGDGEINSQRIFYALTQFMGAMVSSNALFDRYKRGEAGATLSADDLAGLNVYTAKCASCHKEPLFTDFTFRSNGLPPTSVKDSGRAMITHGASDKYKFKVPTLRNLKYTAPYMHDGRFATLEQVLDHYATGIQPNAENLDLTLLGGIPLTAEERAQLLAFLNTLNDESFVKDTRFHEVRL